MRDVARKRVLSKETDANKERDEFINQMKHYDSGISLASTHTQIAFAGLAFTFVLSVPTLAIVASAGLW